LTCQANTSPQSQNQRFDGYQKNWCEICRVFWWNLRRIQFDPVYAPTLLKRNETVASSGRTASARTELHSARASANSAFGAQGWQTAFESVVTAICA